MCWQHRQAGFNKCNYVSLRVQRSSSNFSLKRNPEDPSRANSTWRTVWEIAKRREPGREGKADRNNVVIRSDSKIRLLEKIFFTSWERMETWPQLYSADYVKAFCHNSWQSNRRRRRRSAPLHLFDSAAIIVIKCLLFRRWTARLTRGGGRSLPVCFVSFPRVHNLYLDTGLRRSTDCKSGYAGGRAHFRSLLTAAADPRQIWAAENLLRGTFWK